MKKYKKLWLGLTSVGLAFLTFIVLLLLQQNMKKEPVYEEVLCAKKHIESQIVITEQNYLQYVETRKVPVDCIPEQYLKMPEQLYGKLFLSDVTKDSILTEAMCKNYLEDYENYKCLTWISIPVKELYEGVAGSLRKGDYIDIYTLWKEGDEVRSQLLAERVLIKETYTAQGVRIEDGKEGLSQLIVVPLEKEQVSMFYEMLAKGNIRIAKYEET